MVFALVGCRHGRPTDELEHEVRSGETLLAIAREYGVSMAAIAERNQIANPNYLRVGQRLVIPPERPAPAPEPKVDAEPPVIPLPPPPKAAAPPPLSWSEERGRYEFVWPLNGVVVSYFGPREGAPHDGVDIAAPIGTLVWASAAGEVVYAGDQAGYGTIIIVQHAEGLVTVYAHNQVNLVKQGQKVEQGEPIARVGQSGGATSPGLHFELREGRAAVDPLRRLPR